MAIAPKQRIQVSLSYAAKMIIPALARKRRVPAATLASTLIDEALELQEDVALDRIASRRDTSRARFVSHKVAWKRFTK